MSQSNSLLDRPLIRMPRFGQGRWLNTEHPPTRASLRGQVVLVDFWDYACINCIRTLPYLNAWHKRYREKGLAIVGVHAPEFAFGRLEGQVEAAIAEFEVPYPVLLDNEYETWDRYANKAWPSKHLVDAEGYVRLRRRGEGHYREVEQGIQALLQRQRPGIELPELLPPLRETDRPGAVCYRPTPELYAGYRGGGLYGGALGDEAGYAPEGPVAYTLPGPFDLEEGYFYLAGFWQARPEALVFAGREVGRVVVPYSAAGLNAVLSPSADPIEVVLGLRPGGGDPLVEVRLDDRPLAPAEAGEDVHFEGERALVRVTRPRLYRLTRHGNFGEHQVELILRTPGVALYTFTFLSCVAPDGADDVFRMG